MSFLETRNKAMARILVNLNPSRGLAKKINLQYKDFVFEKILDYEYLPFRCHRCHEYGRLAKEFPLGRRRRRFQRSSTQWEKVFSHNHFSQGKEASGDQIAEEMETEVHLEGQILEAAQQAPLFSGVEKEPELDFDKTKAEKSEEPAPSQKSIESEGAMGMCLDSISPPILNSETIEVCTTPKSPCNNFISDNNERVEKHDVTTVEIGIEDISAAMPSLDLNFEGVSLNPAPSALHPSCPYNLRSLDSKPISSGLVGGIGFLPSQSQKRKKRGRKSNLSIAQIKAKFDVDDGKQQSITGVLRAVQGPENVVK